MQNEHEKQITKQVLYIQLLAKKRETEVWKTNIFQHRRIQSQKAF